jgi:hypothetical protein
MYMLASLDQAIVTSVDKCGIRHVGQFLAIITGTPETI